MSGTNQTNLNMVDWSALPAPVDDGSVDHLNGMKMPSLELDATNGTIVVLAALSGLTIVFIYPMTGRPDVALPDNWDMIPGARGCTPQACSFRDAKADLLSAGADQIFGLSCQSTDYQNEAVERLHLPFPLLSDENGALRDALTLPTMEVEGMRLLKRTTLAVREGVIERTWHPVFPPDQSADVVLNWLKTRNA